MRQNAGGILVIGVALLAAPTSASARATPAATSTSTSTSTSTPTSTSTRAVRPVRLLVPAGPFLRGSAKGDDDERPVRNQNLPAFEIDRTEVTRMAFAACVAARRCKPVPSHLTGPSGSDGNLPITGVSWFDARDFCAFAGGRLPSEAEWEKAARGNDGREFPWGAEPSCDRANWGNFDGEGPCARQNPGFPVAVGRYPDGASPFGALDMGGNVWEWVSDRYDEDPKRRMVRGGSCCTFFVPPRAANRNAWAPDHRDIDLGFRCAGAPHAAGRP